MKTNQELFNTAYTRHVIDNKRLGFSTDEDGTISCSYVLGCAVGCNLTQDELILVTERDDDQCAVNYINLEGIYSFGSKNVNFLADLQGAHDYAAEKLAIEQKGNNFYKNIYHSFNTKRQAVKYNYELVANYYNLEIPTDVSG